MNIIFHLPWPPTVNNYYSHTRQGTYISKKGRQYRESVLDAIKEQSWSSSNKLMDNLSVRLILYPPDMRVRDVDNYTKSLLDALTHADIWKDDTLIDQLFIYRGKKVKYGKVIIIIKEGQMIIPENSEKLIEFL